MAGKAFSFDSLMTDLEKDPFEEMPNYEELKEQIYKMLEGLFEKIFFSKKIIFQLKRIAKKG